MIQPNVRAFTLIEILIATALTIFILSMLMTIWQAAWQTADRTRSILNAHQRARRVMDLNEATLVERSGSMPLIASDNGFGRYAPFKLGAYSAKVHIDYTTMDMGTDASDRDLNGNGRIDPGTNEKGITKKWWVSDNLDTPLPDPLPVPKDSYAAGRDVTTATIGDNGWAWGPDRTLIWHSDLTRYEKNLRLLNGPSVQPAWSYITSTYLGAARDDDNLVRYQQYGWGDTGPWETGYVNLASVAYMTGPYRGREIAPRLHLDRTGVERSTEWLGMTHIFRSISGPNTYLDPWSSNAWVPTRTQDHGRRKDAWGNWAPYEPDWGFATPGNWTTADPTDAAVGKPTPLYGSVIRDGSVLWRCEAPYLRVYRLSDTGGPGPQTGSMIYGDGGRKYQVVVLRNSTVVRTGDSAAYDHQNHQMQLLKRSAWATSMALFRVRTARSVTAWSPPHAAARGRFGSFTLPGWYNGAVATGGGPMNMNDPLQSDRQTPGLMAGFQGATPSGDEPAGHPAWVAVDVGVLSGIDRTYSRPFELRFTCLYALR